MTHGQTHRKARSRDGGQSKAQKIARSNSIEAQKRRRAVKGAERRHLRVATYAEAEADARVQDDEFREEALPDRDIENDGAMDLVNEADWEWRDEDELADPAEVTNSAEGGESGELSDGDGERPTYLIHCSKERASFTPPSWAFGRISGAGDEELSLRFQSYEGIARWVTKDQSEFLEKPTLLNYSHAADVTRPLPVTQEGLWLLTCPDRVPDYTTFTLHLRELAFAWPSSRIVLNTLFSKESQIAWAASAFQSDLVVLPQGRLLFGGKPHGTKTYSRHRMVINGKSCASDATSAVPQHFRQPSS